MGALREADFFAWTQEQAQRLRRAAGYRLNDLTGFDRLGLAGEIEGLGISLGREIASRYCILPVHLLKWALRPDRRRTSRARTAEWARAFAKAHSRARKDAGAETALPLDRFPTRLPFTLDQVEDESFRPEPSGALS